MEWAQVRAMAADGVSQREIAARLGINRRTVGRLIAAAEPPRYERAPAGPMLDPLEPVVRLLIDEWPQIKAPRVTEILRDGYGYAGSVDLVRNTQGALRKRRISEVLEVLGSGGLAHTDRLHWQLTAAGYRRHRDVASPASERAKRACLWPPRSIAIVGRRRDRGLCPGGRSPSIRSRAALFSLPLHPVGTPARVLSRRGWAVSLQTSMRRGRRVLAPASGG
jgi:hypothetical protein